MPAATLAYCPRSPESTLLYRVVATHLETFLVRQHERVRPLPGFVEEEFRSFLKSGILEHGFLRLHCDACGKDRLLPFSCKSRGWCPSCGGRQMSGCECKPDRAQPSSNGRYRRSSCRPRHSTGCRTERSVCYLKRLRGKSSRDGAGIIGI
jgi:hypothetical protein